MAILAEVYVAAMRIEASILLQKINWLFMTIDIFPGYGIWMHPKLCIYYYVSTYICKYHIELIHNYFAKIGTYVLCENSKIRTLLTRYHIDT